MPVFINAIYIYIYMYEYMCVLVRIAFARIDWNIYVEIRTCIERKKDKDKMVVFVLLSNRLFLAPITRTSVMV